MWNRAEIYFHVVVLCGQCILQFTSKIIIFSFWGLWQKYDTMLEIFPINEFIWFHSIQLYFRFAIFNALWCQLVCSLLSRSILSSLEWHNSLAFVGESRTPRTCHTGLIVQGLSVTHGMTCEVQEGKEWWIYHASRKHHRTLWRLLMKAMTATGAIYPRSLDLVMIWTCIRVNHWIRRMEVCMDSPQKQRQLVIWIPEETFQLEKQELTWI